MACNVATSAAITSAAAVSVDTFFTSFSTPPNSNSPFSSPFYQSNTFPGNNNYKSHTLIISKNHPKSHNRTICRAAEYQFPDPIPEFADSETEKFKAHLTKKLSKKDIYGDELDEVVGICTEIFSTFMHAEYGGPGTLLVLPFIDMADTLNEQGLNGGPQAARAAVKWAQAHVDKDWKEWTSSNK